jgi:ABC-2 type transport system ATP-binding protein
MMMNNIIELKKVKKVYKDITTVDIEKITVREGEIYGFLGPNGAGKTTTMKMILSLVDPTSGEIFVNKKDIRKTKIT